MRKSKIPGRSRGFGWGRRTAGFVGSDDGERVSIDGIAADMDDHVARQIEVAVVVDIDEDERVTGYCCRRGDHVIVDTVGEKVRCHVGDGLRRRQWHSV